MMLYGLTLEIVSDILSIYNVATVERLSEHPVRSAVLLEPLVIWPVAPGDQHTTMALPPPRYAQREPCDRRA